MTTCGGVSIGYTLTAFSILATLPPHILHSVPSPSRISQHSLLRSGLTRTQLLKEVRPWHSRKLRRTSGTSFPKWCARHLEIYQKRRRGLGTSYWAAFGNVRVGLPS